MSKYYGQVEGSAETTASRRGFKSIKASVQSYYGSVIMELAETEFYKLCRLYGGHVKI